MDSIPLLHCYECKQYKPTTDFYHNSKGKPKLPCKLCKLAYGKVYRKAHYIPKSPPPPPDGYKRCSRCKDIFPATSEYFRRDRRRDDGLQYTCKTCQNKSKERIPKPVIEKKSRKRIPKLIVEGMKRCSSCPKDDQWHPATSEYFYRDKRTKDGWQYNCKECFKRKWRETHPLPEPLPVGLQGMKCCFKCKEWKPATSEFFYRAKQVKDGFTSRCKACMSQRKHPLPESVYVPDGYKRCPGCLEVKPATPEYYHRNKYSKNGLTSRCKVCTVAEGRAYRQRPEAKERRQSYTYEYNRRPGIQDYKRSQRQLPQNKEHKRIYQRERRKRPEAQEYDRTYRKDYNRRPEARELARVQNHTYTARKKAVPGEHTPEQIQEQFKRQKGKCYYARCGHAKFERIKENGKWKYLFHIDHTFPLSRVAGTDIPANDISYLVLTCPSCNESKNNKYPWEWPEGGRLL